MAEGTRLKELAADSQRCRNEVKQLTVDFARMMEMHQATNDRLEQLALEIRNHTTSGDGDSSQGTPHHFNNGEGNHTPFQVRGLKVDFPRFNGSNALQWIYQAEQFFEIYHVPEEQKVPIAGVYFDPDVLPWYQMTRRNSPENPLATVH